MTPGLSAGFPNMPDSAFRTDLQTRQGGALQERRFISAISKLCVTSTAIFANFHTLRSPGAALNIMNVCNTLEEALDDLCMRFVNNMPSSEYESFSRLLFTLESAHWFYSDFLREQNPKLPGLNFRQFVDKIFEHSPFLRPFVSEVDALVAEFKRYKQEVPTYGAAMISPDLTKVLLVRGWGNNGKWGFPKGKIAKGETELQAAVREVQEETGFDFSTVLATGVVPFFIDCKVVGRMSRIFVIPDVPEDTVFETQTRKEISAIEWKVIDSLPDSRGKKAADAAAVSDKQANGGMSMKNTWLVSQYMPQLKSYVRRRREGGDGKSRDKKVQDSPAARKAAASLESSSRQAASAPTSAQTANMANARRSFAAQPPLIAVEELGNGVLTDGERDSFFRQYLQDADNRKDEMGIGDDFWPVPLLSSKDYLVAPNGKDGQKVRRSVSSRAGQQGRSSAKNGKKKPGEEMREVAASVAAAANARSSAAAAAAAKKAPGLHFKFNREPILACLV